MASDSTSGCPVVAASQAGPESPELPGSAEDTFTGWGHSISTYLQRFGVRSARAHSLAVMVVCAIEGAVVRSIAARSADPLDHVRTHLAELVGPEAR